MDVEKLVLKRLLRASADILALTWVKAADRNCACSIDVSALCPACKGREEALAAMRDASRMTEEEEAAFAQHQGLAVSGAAWAAATRDALEMLGGLNDPPDERLQLP